jgi:hypothetical protein
VLVINDHFLKAAFPSWWTGKLSDFAGLFFAPLLVAEISLLVLRSERPLRRVAICCVAVGLVFALIKTLPLASAAWSATLGSNARDATDLIALPMVAAAWLFARSATWPCRAPRDRC